MTTNGPDVSKGNESPTFAVLVEFLPGPSVRGSASEAAHTDLHREASPCLSRHGREKDHACAGSTQLPQPPWVQPAAHDPLDGPLRPPIRHLEEPPHQPHEPPRLRHTVQLPDVLQHSSSVRIVALGLLDATWQAPVGFHPHPFWGCAVHDSQSKLDAQLALAHVSHSPSGHVPLAGPVPS